jgi:hypothetical protein
MKNFRQLLVWQKGLQIATNAFKLVSTFPGEQKFLFLQILQKEAAAAVKRIIADFLKYLLGLHTKWRPI